MTATKTAHRLDRAREPQGEKGERVMEDVDDRGPDPQHFRKVTIYKGRKKTITEKMPVEEADKLKANGFDFYWDLVRHEAKVRTRTSKVIPYLGDIKGLGPVKEALLHTLMRAPGFFWLHSEIGRANGNIDSLYVKDCVVAYVCRIRKAFGEDGKRPWFILTRTPFAVAWHPDRSYCLIERPDSNHAKSK